MNQLLEQLKDFHYKESDLFSGNSCAIVGSSGNLLNNKFGNEIDNHDFVIRFNQARVVGYEKYVGSKTSLRVINAHIPAAINGDMNNFNENAEVFSKWSPDIFSELKEKNYLCKTDVNIDIVSKLYPDIIFNKISHHTTSFLLSKISPIPTCGFLALAISLANFDKITCYGFDQYKGDSDHYYQEVKKYDRGGVHNLSMEQMFLSFLHDNKIIELK